MPEKSPHAVTSINAAEEAPPSWQELREDGAVLIDTPDLKLAVYVGEVGCVVLASEQPDDPVPRFIALEHDFVLHLVAALGKAQANASAVGAEWEKKYEAAEAEMMAGAQA